MASKSLGTLTIDLIAKVGGFTQGMDKAERSSTKWRKQVETDVKAAGAAIAGMVAIAATASVAAASAGVALLKTTSAQVTETDRWAKSLKMSTQDLLSWQYAAEQAGLSGDNIADIFKDVNDKIGDAVLNKSGEAAQALDTLGLSAKKLAEQTPDKQLLAIATALQKIPTQAGKTNILESLGNDLSKMLPLFDNNNEKLEKFIQLSKDFGVAPPQEDIDNLVKVNQFFENLETQAKGLKIEIASGLAKVDLQPLQDGLDDMKKVFTDPAVLEGLTKLVGGLAQLVGWMGKLSAESANFISQLSEVPERFKAGGWYEFAQNKKLQSLADNLSGDISAITQPGSKENQPKDNSLGKGDSNQKHTNSGDTAAKKLESAYKAVEQSYLQQIALTDKLNGKTKEATELEKLRFDITTGKLSGVNKVQQERLEGLATEIDKLTVLKKFSEMEDDLLTPEEKLLETTKERVKLLKQAKELGIANPEQYKKASQAISKSTVTDAPQFSGLDASIGGAAGELMKTSEAEKELNKWHTKQLKMQKDLLDQKLINEQEYADRVSEINTKNSKQMEGIQAAYNISSISMFSDLADQSAQLLQSIGSEGSFAYKALFAASKASAMAQSLINTELAATKALAEGGLIFGIPAATAIRAVGYASVALIAGQTLAGMAHDGMDSVPETGTWLLQKGERVTTAQTSAKLDATLDRVNKDSTASAGGDSSTTNIYVTGDPDKSTIRAIQAAVAQGKKEAKAEMTADIANPQGHFGKTLKTYYNRTFKT